MRVKNLSSDLSWLLRCPASDLNWRLALKRASLNVLEEALRKWDTKENLNPGKTGRRLLEAEINRKTKR